MLSFNENITIYCKRYDRDAGVDVWRRVNVSGASWDGKRAANVTEKGYVSANAYIACILSKNLPEGYVHPDEFNHTDVVATAWTMQKHDIVVRGRLDVDITDSTEIIKRYSEHFTILGTKDNRNRPLGHIRIEGA